MLKSSYIYQEYKALIEVKLTRNECRLLVDADRQHYDRACVGIVTPGAPLLLLRTAMYPEEDAALFLELDVDKLDLLVKMAKQIRADDGALHSALLTTLRELIAENEQLRVSSR